MNTEAKIFEAIGGSSFIAHTWPQAKQSAIPGTQFTMVTFGDGSSCYLNKIGEVVPKKEVAGAFWADVLRKPEVMNHFLSQHKDLWPEALAQAFAKASAKDTFSALVWDEMAKNGERF